MCKPGNDALVVRCQKGQNKSSQPKSKARITSLSSGLRYAQPLNSSVMQINKLLIFWSIILGILLAAYLWHFAFKAANRQSNHFVRIGVKAFVFCVFFSPALASSYIVAFPVPFLLAVAFYIFESAKFSILHTFYMILFWCVLPFVVTWIVVFGLGVSSHYLKMYFGKSKKY